MREFPYGAIVREKRLEFRHSAVGAGSAAGRLEGGMSTVVLLTALLYGLNQPANFFHPVEAAPSALRSNPSLSLPIPESPSSLENAEYEYVLV